MFLVKLGGSIITDKTKQYVFKQKITTRLAQEIQKAGKKLIIVHGAGSFGHILAKQYQLNEGYQKKQQLAGFSQTQTMVQQLNTSVLTILQKNNIPAVSIPPHAVLTLKNHQPARIDLQVFESYLDQGFIPVTFGDVVLDEKLGFSICSGDLMVQILAAHFMPEKVIFVLDEDGLYTGNPKSDKNATFIERATIRDLEQFSTDPNIYADVTQGMKGKLDTIKNISQLGIETILVNGKVDNRLYNIMVGKQTTSTCIIGEKK